MKINAKDLAWLLYSTFGLWFPVVFFGVCALVAKQ